MRIAPTVVALICLSAVVHVIDSGSWSRLRASPLSGGDPVPCTGGILQKMCEPKPGRSCFTGYSPYDPNSTTKTRTQKPTELACKASIDCVQPDYSPTELGCIQFP